MKGIDQCQKDQVKKLRRSKNYREASAYTIIYDLLKSGIDKEEINVKRLCAVRDLTDKT